MTREMAFVAGLALANGVWAGGGGTPSPSTSRPTSSNPAVSDPRPVSYQISGTTITFSSINFSDKDMEILDTHPELTSIRFVETFIGSVRMPGGGIGEMGRVAFSISDEGFSHIAKVTNLESLTLDLQYPMHNLTDNALGALKGLKLKTLDLGKTKFTAKGLQALAGVGSLTSFSAEASVPVAVIDAAAQMPHLRVLKVFPRATNTLISRDAPQNPELPGDEDIAKLAALTELEELYLDPRTDFGGSGSRLTDGCTATLAKLTKLKVLHVQGARLTDAGVAKLAGLSDLEELNLSTTDITDAAMKTIGGFQKLKTLMISNTDITDAGMLSLPKMPDLENIYLEHTAISDNGMTNLDRFPKLQYLDVLGSKVDPAINRLRGLRGRGVR